MSSFDNESQLTSSDKLSIINEENEIESSKNNHLNDENNVNLYFKDPSIFKFITSIKGKTSNSSKTKLDTSSNIVVDDLYTISQDNKLLELKYRSILIQGQLSIDEIPNVLNYLKVCFEDSSISDDDIIIAIRFNDFAYVKFILAVINAELYKDYDDVAAKCLAFAGSIYHLLWNQFCLDVHNIIIVLKVCQIACKRIHSYIDLLKILYHQQAHTGSYKDAYIGYDARDMKEYDMEGYEETDTSEIQAKIEEIKDHIRVWLLFLYQIFCHRINKIYEKIHLCRMKKTPRRSRRKSILYDEALLVSFEDSCVSSLSKKNVSIEDIDWIHFYCDLSQMILDTTVDLSDDLYMESIKLITVINMQLPYVNINSSMNYTEVTTIFTNVDTLHESKLINALLHYLNDNGYPNINCIETPAAIELCYNLFFYSLASTNHITADIDHSFSINNTLNTTTSNSAEKEDMKIMDNCYFYANDIKILVDLIIRELRNIPPFLKHQSHYQSTADTVEETDFCDSDPNERNTVEETDFCDSDPNERNTVEETDFCDSDPNERNTVEETDFCDSDPNERNTISNSIDTRYINHCSNSSHEEQLEDIFSYTDNETLVDGRVRKMYLKLLDAILGNISWSTVTYCYMKDALREVLVDIANNIEDYAQPFAEEILQKYETYLY